jgi:hypothetical protein
MGTGDECQDKLLRYRQRSDHGLQPLLREQRAPLVLDTALAGNPDELAPAVLHERASAITVPCWEHDERAVLAWYQEHAGTGLTSTDLAEIVMAASQGRVAVLLLATLGSRQPPGSPATTAACNLATIETLTHSGTVYVVPPAQLPTRAACVALYRY